MRTFLFSVVLFFSTFAFCQVQMWVSDNAVWHYEYWDIGSFGFIKVEHIGDSVIEGELTKCFQSSDFKFTFDQFNEPHFLGIEVIDTNYTYTSNDTVYYLFDNEFETLFNFAATDNDIWEKGENGVDDFDCSSHSVTEVLGTGSVDIMGTSYRTLTLNSPDSCLHKQNGIVNERFGVFSNTFSQHSFLFPTLSVCDPIPNDTYFFKFICFEDDDLYFNPNSQDCEYPLNHLSIEEISGTELLIYPNPFHEYINVVSADQLILNVSLIDAKGQVVSSWEFDEGQYSCRLNISQLANGYLILEIGTEQSISRRPLILK